MPRYSLGLDFGTESVRALIVGVRDVWTSFGADEPNPCHRYLITRLLLLAKGKSARSNFGTGW